MSLEDKIQYLAMALALFALYLGRRGMKRYVPVALFAALYADLVCDVGVEGLELWSFPSRLADFVQESLPANLVAIPIIAMFWIRYCPRSKAGTYFWALAWALPLALGEYFVLQNTSLIEYRNGYQWYHSFILWLISFSLWRLFHNWFYSGPSD